MSELENSGLEKGIVPLERSIFTPLNFQFLHIILTAMYYVSSNMQNTEKRRKNTNNTNFSWLKSNGDFITFAQVLLAATFSSTGIQREQPEEGKIQNFQVEDIYNKLKE